MGTGGKIESNEKGMNHLYVQVTKLQKRSNLSGYVETGKKNLLNIAIITKNNFLIIYRRRYHGSIDSVEMIC